MKSVFKDKEKLSPSYIPDKIPHREDKLKELKDYFNQVISEELDFTHLFIIGNTGTGKTLVAKHMEKYVKDVSNGKIITTYINARIERIPGNIVRQMIKRLSPYIPIRGYSVEEMYLYLLDDILKNNKKIFLILDDSDHIFDKYPEFIYKLSRVDELLEGRKNPLSILFILHNSYMLNKLDPWTLAGLRKNVVYFEDYVYEELLDILETRAKEAFYEDSIDNESIETAADISSTYNYNARYGIELLFKAGLIADKRRESIVKPEHVRLARFEVPPSFSYEDIISLRLNEKILLYSLAEILLTENRSFVSTGDLEKKYKEISRYFNIDPVGHTWFWKMINTLASFGLISKRPSPKNMRGRTTLIGLPSFSASILLDRLRKMIEDDITRFRGY